MSYTLIGRLESRLAASLAPLLIACLLSLTLQVWWPVELASLMLATGLVLDLAYDRVLDYQPGWLALPIGLLEFGLIMVLARWVDIQAPLRSAIWFFVCSWLLAQILAHAGFPLLSLSYAEDGGELSRVGLGAAATVLALLVSAGGVAWATQPPTVTLAAGIHQGPIVIDHSQHLAGAQGAIVRGGIVVRASDVRVSGITVIGGENGIDVDNARRVVLDHVTVVGAKLDGIHVRRSTVTIRDCKINSNGNAVAQGIDISYAFDLGESMVERCNVVGGNEGIVTHFANAMLKDNAVSGTALRGIAVTEMSMGMVDRNRVDNSLGVGIFCGDHSMCEVERNTVSDTRADTASGDRTRIGFGILAHYGAEAELHDNRIMRSPGGVGAMLDARIKQHH